jgi:hypothetical protein
MQGVMLMAIVKDGLSIYVCNGHVLGLHRLLVSRASQPGCTVNMLWAGYWVQRLAVQRVKLNVGSVLVS